ncbi:MAG: hypothetical protein HY692_02535 [Cyanobacteria bacterium NC_groundwater_1444_Ag_S-0.65um_54_12]|nr:hypothetical protein [Cyanobacteria bacterium NC_groundwater_1444_Ag_S-0.65um_54_12]
MTIPRVSSTKASSVSAEVALESTLKRPAPWEMAAGVRWLGYKYARIPKGRPKNIFNMLRNYRDWDLGEKYAKEVLAVYEKSK